MNKRALPAAIQARHFPRPHALRRQAGITLIELIAALAIVALIIVGALALIKQADIGTQSTAMLRGLNGMRANVKAFYSAQGTYGTGDINEPMITANQIPADWTFTAPKTIKHNLKQAVNITGLNFAGLDTFQIVLAGVPGPVCQRVALASGSSGWRQIDVNGTVLTLPLDVAQIGTACGNDDSTPKPMTFISN